MEFRRGIKMGMKEEKRARGKRICKMGEMKEQIIEFSVNLIRK